MTPPAHLTHPQDTIHHAEAASLIAQPREHWGFIPQGICRVGDLSPEKAPATEGNEDAILPRRRMHSVFYLHEGRLVCDLVRGPDIFTAASRWSAERGLPEEAILNVCFRRDALMVAYSGGYAKGRDQVLVWQPARIITALIWLREDLCVELTGDVWPCRPK